MTGLDTVATAKTFLQTEADPGMPGLELWWRQFTTVLGREIKCILFSKQVLVVLLLVALPIAVVVLVGLFPTLDGEPLTQTINYARTVYGYIYTTLLGAVFYLGIALIFTALLRGEILNRSIHFALLTPIRREILVLGKFTAGIFSSVLLFGSATIVCYLLLYLPFGANRLSMDLSGGVVLQQMATYLLMTCLACIGYGSVFMATGLLFRNPLIPLVAVAGWELINFILPPGLKLISVVYYLRSLMPVLIDAGPLPLAVISSPLPTWASMLGISVLCILSLAIAVVYLKRLEIRYTDD